MLVSGGYLVLWKKNKRVSEMAVIYHTCLQVYTNLEEYWYITL